MDIELNGKTDTKSYSISEISALTGESRAKIYRWIDGFGQVDEFKASADERDGGKYYPRSQWEALLASQGREFPDSQEVDVEVELPMTGFSGLVSPLKCSSLGVSSFDMEEYKQHKAILEGQSAARATALNEAVVKYAQSRMAQTLADIDVVAAQVRDNAFKAMGMGGDG